MEDSTNTLIYTATYIFIFVIALSISITLLFSVNKFADSAFNYQQNLQSSVINTQTTGNESNNTVTLGKNDVISYYYNYIKRDIYSSGEVNANNDVIYKVDLTIGETQVTKDTEENIALSTINSNDTYYLRYKSNVSEGSGKIITVSISNN